MSKGKCPTPGCDKAAERRGYCRNHLYRLEKYGDPLMGNPTPGTLPQWIEAHKNHVGADCLIWPFHRSTDGYARWCINGRGKNVHATMCEHRNGPRPSPRHHAAHTCGKGSAGCVNPQHMEWKTFEENEADKVRHGTRIRGERSPNAKLTEDDVRKIRAAKGKQRDIAKRFGVGQASVWRIRHKITWGHVDG